MSVEKDSPYFSNLEKARNKIQDPRVRKAMEQLAPLEPRRTGILPGGGPRDGIKALLLDIYGTLFISGSGDIGLLRNGSADYRFLEWLLAAFGIRQGPQQVIEGLEGLVAAEHLRAKEAGIEYPEVVIEEIWQRLLGFSDRQTARSFALCFELLTNPVWPMPFLQDLIAGCVGGRIVLGVISNAQFYTPLLFEWFLGNDLSGLGFDSELLFFSYRHGRAKPAPEMFQMAIDVLAQKGIAAAQALYLGNDMLNDVLPAKKCGMQAALFAGDGRSLRLREDHEAISGLVPDWTVTNLAQIVRGL